VRRIGYAKIGRSITFDRDKYGFQGDAEAPQLLERLALRNLDVEFVCVGATSKFEKSGMPSNVSNLWDPSKLHPNNLAREIATLDGCIVHLGQHGTSHTSIPMSDKTWEDWRLDPKNCATGPLAWAASYGAFLVNGLNWLGDRTDGSAPVVWLCADPRNYLKGRDVKWPPSTILAQYQYARDQKHERHRDPRLPEWWEDGSFDHCRTERQGELWVAKHRYVYGGLELMILPDDWSRYGDTPFEERIAASISTTSFGAVPPGEPRRSELVRDYLLKVFPFAPVWGKWDEDSLKDVAEGTVTQAPVDQFMGQLESSRITLVLPALGTSWTTAKPYQCWAANTVSFFIDRVDDQGWVLPSRRHADGADHCMMSSSGMFWSVRDDWTEDEVALAMWLRVESVAEFEARAKIVSQDKDTWEWITRTQRGLLEKRWREAYLERSIETLLGLDGNE
jgi:hypothetical protein